MNSSNHCGRSRKRSFDFCESLAGFHDQFPSASSSLRSEAGHDDVLVGALDSCDGDVEDELDNPGTTSSTTFSGLHLILPCLVTVAAGPLEGVSVFIAELSQ